MNKWFEVKVKYTKQLENGTFKRVVEPYLLCAMTFTDAEARIYDELVSIIRGEFSVIGVNPKNYQDIYITENEDSYFYEVQVKMQDCNLDSDKIKIVTQTYLANGDTLPKALDNISESFKDLVSDFTVVGIKLTSIVDIFPYRESVATEQPVIEESTIEQPITEEV